MTTQDRLAAALRVADPLTASSWKPVNGAKDPAKVRAGRESARRRWGHTDAGHTVSARMLAADPNLAQDIADGQALRLLREALPKGWDMTVRTFAIRWCVEVWDPYYPPGRDDPPQPRYLEIADTIAEAADACRKALGGRQ